MNCIKRLPQSNRLQAIGNRSTYWNVGQTIKVAFMAGTFPQRDLVKVAINELMEFVNLNFVFTDNFEESDIRIGFIEGDGSWSYLGTDALQIPKTQPTMNFGWLHKTTPTDIGTIKHELTHAIGAEHEHSFPNGITFILEAIRKDIGHIWSDQMIIHNIINQSNPNKVDTTDKIDLNSIMLYQFPAHWNKEGIATKQNTDWSKLDREFWSSIYTYPIKGIDYKEVLLTLYSDKNITNLLKSTHANIADQLGVDSHGLERTVIKNIINGLRN